MKRIYIGTAGWSIPREHARYFPVKGSHLERYARVLSAVENDSTFYGVHERHTYARWAASVPAAFRIAGKMPRTISHYARLKGTSRILDGYLSAVAGLGRKRVEILQTKVTVKGGAAVVACRLSGEAEGFNLSTGYNISGNWELRQNINALSVGHEVTFTSEPFILANFNDVAIV